MATYAIGDVQGCFKALQQLIKQIAFDPTRDRLWFVGDLVNRGPDSLGVLRYVKGLGKSAVTVLGNHDVHLLAVAAGAAPQRAKDTLHDILTASDRDELLQWLKQQPLLHRQDKTVMVHGGMLPQWTIGAAESLAREAEQTLRAENNAAFLRSIYEDRLPSRWTDDLTGMARAGVVTRVFTRLRVCTKAGEMNLAFTGPPEQAPEGFLPWFQIPERKSADATILCGHWAALGLRLEPNVMVLDSGCVWGNKLTAIRLEDRQVFQVSCASRS
jgi:bis(5'-nucleosyl)-tetraphosphatase (symmetrical)